MVFGAISSKIICTNNVRLNPNLVYSFLSYDIERYTIKTLLDMLDMSPKQFLFFFKTLPENLLL